MPAAPVEGDFLLRILWQQTVKPAMMQGLDPQALGSRPESPPFGCPSGHGLNCSPSGVCPHAQACSSEGNWRCCEGEQCWQAGWVWLGYSDTGALQQQDAACHQVGYAQAEQQHLSPLQEAVQSVVGCYHSVYCLSPYWKAISWNERIWHLLTTSKCRNDPQCLAAL